MDTAGSSPTAPELAAVDPGGPGFRLVLAAVVTVFIGIATVGLLPSSDAIAELPASVESSLPSVSADAATTPVPTDPPIVPVAIADRDDPCFTSQERIEPGPFEIPWLGSRIRLTMPTGWRRVADSTTSTRFGPCGGSSTLEFQVADVAQVPLDICRSGRPEGWIDVGPRADDLVTALATATAPAGFRGADSTLAGRRFTRVDLWVDECSGGPEGRLIWRDSAGTGFGVLKGGSGTVYAAEVDGARLVLAISERDASNDDLADVEVMLDSMTIETPG